MARKKPADNAAAETQPEIIVVVLKTREGFGRKGQLRRWCEAFDALDLKAGTDYRKATAHDIAIGAVS